MFVVLVQAKYAWEHITDLVEILILRPLQLLLQEQHNLFHIPAGCQTQNNTERLSPNLQIRAGDQLEDVHDHGIQDMTVS